MRFRTWFSWCCLAASAVTVAVAWREQRRWRNAAAQRAEMSAERARRETALRRARERLAAAEAERARLQTPPGAAVAEPNRPLPTAESRAPEPNPLAVLVQQEREPEMQALRLAAESTRLRLRYRLLFRELALSAEQIARFEANLLKRETQIADIASAATARRLSDDDDAVARLNGKVFDEYEAEQRALLGDAGWRRTVSYEQTMGARDIAGGLAGAAALEGAAFTTAQTERLAETIIRAGRRDARGNWQGTDAIDWERVDVEAMAFLTSDQLRLLRTISPQAGGGSSRFGMRLGTLIERAQAADAGQGGGR